MLNVKEAAEQMTLAGIPALEEDVLLWIQQGKLKAERTKRRNSTYQLTVQTVIEFIKKRHSAKLASQLQESVRRNDELTEHLELLQARLNIEQAKVRTLKKLLNTQIEAAGEEGVQFVDLLGLGKESDSRMLKKEFKKLLKALHPDRGGDERLFKVFNEHYENLKIK